MKRSIFQFNVLLLFLSVALSSVAWSGADAKEKATAAVQAKAATEAKDEATTPSLNKWQKLYLERVELFEKENAELAPDARPIVFVGDSLTQGMPVKTLYPDRLVLNRGIVSDGLSNWPNAEPPHYRGLMNRLGPSIFDPNPKLLFLLMGTNDVGLRSVSLDYWEETMGELLDKIAADIPDCQVVMHTLPPTGPPYKRVESLNERAREYNERLKKIAEERGLPIIDLWSLYVSDEGVLPSDCTRDGLHLKKECYDRWANEAIKYFPKED